MHHLRGPWPLARSPPPPATAARQVARFDPDEAPGQLGSMIPTGELLADPRVAAAIEVIRASAAETVEEQIALTRIPAPPFGEAARARAVRDRLAALGLAPEIDEVGNVLARLPGTPGGEPVVLSAHLDTVFPAGTPIEVRRDGDIVRAPGISDDGRGLAVVLAVARALRAAGIRTGRTLLLVATVGEEGAGDLRGARHLVGASGAARGASAFVSVDGAGLERIVTRGLGSRRVRASVRGPGGHSWQDRGRVNPLHALADAVAELAELRLPGGPESSLTVTRWGGGKSINAIPQEAWIDVDIRGVDPERPAELEGELRQVLADAVAREHGRSAGTLASEVTLLGVRPAGRTPEDHPLVLAADAATREVGARPIYVVSSTDANAAMAAGIPAITIGGGGLAGLAHTTDEWYEDERGADGVVRALLTVLSVAGLAD